jgi:hypothetical protein
MEQAGAIATSSSANRSKESNGSMLDVLEVVRLRVRLGCHFEICDLRKH